MRFRSQHSSPRRCRCSWISASLVSVAPSLHRFREHVPAVRAVERVSADTSKGSACLSYDCRVLTELVLDHAVA